jgi:hypothetical protein
METNSEYRTPHITGIPTPSGKGTFSIMRDGTLVGYPESSAVEMWMLTPIGDMTIRYTNSKTVYLYEEVPMEVGLRLITAESVGEFVNKVIKPNYRVLAL